MIQLRHVHDIAEQAGAWTPTLLLIPIMLGTCLRCATTADRRRLAGHQRRVL